MVALSPRSGGRSRPRPDSGARSWDTVHPPRRGQALTVTAACLLLACGVLTTGLRVFPPHDDAPALLAAFIPYGVLAYGGALLLLVVSLVRARRRAVLAVLAAACAALLALHLSWLAPLFVADRRPAGPATFTVLSLNTLSGAADADQLVNAAASADLVVLIEATAEGVQRLEQAGWRDRFRYVAGNTVARGSGAAIYSRFPLRNGISLPPTSFQQEAVTAQVPGLGPVRVIAAHPCNPFCGHNRWATEHDVLRAAVAGSPPNLPLVVAGDFNAVEDHGPIQALRRAGLVSATDLAGAGWLPTYPANSWVPPLLPIDHVLVDEQLTALSVERVAVAGTDHLGLRARLAARG